MFEESASVVSPEGWLDVCVPGRRVEDAFAAELERGALAAAEAADARREALGGAPGPDLAALLARLAVPAEPDAVLLEAIDAFDRLAAWAASRQAVAVNELRRRRQPQGRAAFVADEVAARLGTTRAAGQRVVGEAMGLEQVPQVWDALDRGAVDPRKAAMLCDELLALPPQLRFDVASEVVPLAGGLTIPALRGRIRRRALAADPEAARTGASAAGGTSPWNPCATAWPGCTRTSPRPMPSQCMPRSPRSQTPRRRTTRAGSMRAARTRWSTS